VGLRDIAVWVGVAVSVVFTALPERADAQTVRSAYAVADEMASHVASLFDWPPFAALRVVPPSLRESWRDQLTMAAEQARALEERLLASVLIEVLEAAHSFDQCNLKAGLVDAGGCYPAWLRYHMGWAVDPQEVHKRAVRTARLGVPGGFGASETNRRPRHHAGQLIPNLLESIQRTDAQLRSSAAPLIPFDADYDSVAIRFSPGPPIAAYLGSDRMGRPFLQIDTAAARTWGDDELRRILSHEVWPGHHLVASTARTRIHPILQGARWLGFSEGWATYAEVLMSTPVLGHTVEPFVERQVAGLALLALTDVRIHSLGWSTDEAARALTESGGYSTAEAAAAVTTVQLNPGQQASYYVGYATFACLGMKWRRPGMRSNFVAFTGQCCSTAPSLLVWQKKSYWETPTRGQLMWTVHNRCQPQLAIACVRVSEDKTMSPTTFRSWRLGKRSSLGGRQTLSDLLGNLSIVFPVVGVLFAGCGEERPQRLSEITDSSGVEVVAHAISPDQLPVKEVQSPPVLSGGPGVPGSSSLFDVRGLALTEGGRVAVANNGSKSIIILDADHRVAAEFGREGVGPGEFTAVESVISVGDSLLVYDPSLRRITVFETDGRLVRTVDLADIVPQDGWSELLPLDRGLIVLGLGGLGGRRALGTFREPAEVRLVSGEGAMITSYGTFPGTEMVIAERLMGRLPFGAQLAGTTYANVLVVGEAEGPEIRYYDAAGEFIRVVRWRAKTRRISRDRFEEFLQFQLQDISPEQRAAARRQLESLPHADHAPPYLDLMATEQGEVWIGTYPGPEALLPTGARRSSRSWIVVAPDGGLRERVITPVGFKPLLLTSQRIYGVFEDDLGVESVRAYERVE